MPKEEWGVKRLCPTTGKRFYDLNKTPIISPYTGDVVNVDTNNKARSLTADKSDANSVKETEEEAVVDTEVDAELDADENADLGDDVLDDDDDDNVSLDEIADVESKDDDD